MNNTGFFTMRKILLLTVVIILTYSCKEEKQAIDGNYSYIFLDSLSDRNMIEDNIHRCRFIKLETTEDCLMGAILKIEFDDDKIFISDSNEKLFVFNNKGMYLHTIGKIGQGPEEQLSMLDFYLNKIENSVNIIDIFKSVIFTYAYSGKLLGISNLENDLLNNTSKVALLDEHHLLMMKANNSSSLFNYSVFDAKNNEKKAYLPYMAIGSKSMSFGESTFTQTGKSTYMCAFLSDTIYKYDHKTNMIIPQWIFKGDLKPGTKEDFDGKDYVLGFDATLTAQNKKLSIGVPRSLVRRKPGRTFRR